MNELSIYFYIAFACIAVYVYSSIRIIGELRKRDIPVNFFLLRILIIKYANDYRKITIEEQGYTGRLYHLWLISVNGALVFVVLGILNLKGVI
jgi:hypothetical protein